MHIRKEFKIGIFVILVLVATFVVINILRGADIFGREKNYKCYFYDVETLVPSSPVLFRGFNAGKVSDVNYDAENDRFEVVCSIKKEFAIPTDSKMMLYSTSIMGGKGIRIVPGTAGEMAADGAVLESGSELDLMSSLSAQIGPMMLKINNLLDSAALTVNNVNAVLDEHNRSNLRSTLAHLEQTVKNAEELSACLGGESEGISDIITNLKKISTGLVPVIDSLGVSISNVNAITGNVAKADLKSTIEKTDKTIENIGVFVEQIQQPLDSILTDTDQLIKAIKANPKKYMKISVF